VVVTCGVDVVAELLPASAESVQQACEPVNLRSTERGVGHLKSFHAPTAPGLSGRRCIGGDSTCFGLLFPG
jgi:hypothetical protein